MIVRDLGETPDHCLISAIADGNVGFVTDSARGFLRLHAREPIHSELGIVVPSQRPRPNQIERFNAVLDAIEPLSNLTNNVIEVFRDRSVRIRDWPTPA